MNRQDTSSKESIVDTFDQYGFVIIPGVVDQDLIKEMNDHVDWLQRHHPDVRPEQLGHTYLRDDPFWVSVVSDPRLVDIAELFVGPNVALFASHYICKPPFSGQPVLWHQDGAFWALEPMNVVSLWLAVDHSTPDNGCLRVIPGSHRDDLGEMRDNTAVDNVLGSEIAVDVDVSRAADIVLAPGDVEVHHPHIVHGSNANESPHRRCGLTIRYIPTSTRITADEQPYPSAFLLRGDPGVNLYQPRPAYVAGVNFPFGGHESWNKVTPCQSVDRM